MEQEASLASRLAGWQPPRLPWARGRLPQQWGARADTGPLEIRWGEREPLCLRKLLRGTRSRATETVALPLSRAKPARLPLESLCRRPQHAEFGWNGRACAWMWPFALRSCCGWGVAHSRAPVGSGLAPFLILAQPHNLWLNSIFFIFFPPNCLPWVRSLRGTVRGWRAHVDR